MFDMHCVIFAGGKSSRMGQDKALLPFGGYDTLIEYQYKRMKKIFKEVSISSKSTDKIEFTCNIIEDPKEIKIFAPTAGFVALFNILEDERVFILSVDTPFVTEEEITQLLHADNPTLDATIAKTATGAHPMCGIYHRSLHVKFTTMLQEDNHRLGRLLKESHTCYVSFKDDNAFTNLNHPHEYQEALKRLV